MSNSEQKQNPYIVGDSVGGSDAFVGRSDIIDKVNSILKHQNHYATLLYGQRRIGKSSILKHLETEFKQNNQFKPVFFDLLGKAYQPPIVTLKELARKIDVSGNHPPDFDKINDFHEQWLPKVLSENQDIVILLDEFDALDNMSAKREGDNLFHYIRDNLLPLKKVNIVFTLGRNIEDNVSTLSLFKSMPTNRVSLLPYEDTVKLIRLSEDNDSLNWSKEAIETVWKLTKGHPYLTQMLCYQVWESLYLRRLPQVEQNLRGLPQVKQTDVEGQIKNTLDQSKGTLIWLWEGLPPTERIVAFFIANQKTFLSEEQLTELLRPEKHANIPDQSSLILILESLIKWDFIEKHDHGYSIRVELIRKWIVDKSLAQIKHEIDEYKPEARSFYNAAKSSHEVRDSDGALRHIEGCLKLKPDHLGANRLKVEILIEQNKLQEAYQCANGFYEYHPNDARNDLVRVLKLFIEQEDNIKQKLDYYNEILEFEPDNINVRQSMIDIFIEQNELETARQHLEQFYRSQPQRFALKFITVLLKLAQQATEIEQQLPYYLKILKIDPTQKTVLDTMDNLGEQFLQKGDIENALKAFQATDSDKAGKIVLEKQFELHKAMELYQQLGKHQKAKELDYTLKLMKRLDEFENMQTTKPIEALLVNTEYEKVLFNSTSHTIGQLDVVKLIKLIKAYQKKIEYVFNDNEMRYTILKYETRIIGIYFLDAISSQLAICFVASAGSYPLGKFIPECEKQLPFLIKGLGNDK